MLAVVDQLKDSSILVEKDGGMPRKILQKIKPISDSSIPESENTFIFNLDAAGVSNKHFVGHVLYAVLDGLQNEQTNQKTGFFFNQLYIKCGLKTGFVRPTRHFFWRPSP